MESKFLDQDVDVMLLANKGIGIGCFADRNYNKTLMETGKAHDAYDAHENQSFLCYAVCRYQRNI